MTKEERDFKRHKRIWTFCRHTLGPLLTKKYNCEFKLAEGLPEPFILLANHSTDLDPVLIGMCCPQQMYFIASEHVYRKGFVSKLLYWAFQPIAKIKGASDALTVMKAIRTLRSGKNVALFPDGNRSFNGRTGPMTDAIGKLVKTSGANLVTFNIAGGFFTNPRWGFGIRRGKMSAGVVNIYTKEQLKEMDVSQVRKVIEADTAENAYARQDAAPVAFKGKNLAEGMECSLCTCPKCGTIGSITTKKNNVSCMICGSLTDYSPYGYFDNGFNFKTVEQWDDWQEEFYRNCVKKAAEQIARQEAPEEYLFFKDENLRLNQIKADHSQNCLGTGTLMLYMDSLVFKTESSTLKLELKDIPDMNMYGKTGLMFTDNEGLHYELKTDRIINVRKYISFWSIIKENKTISEEL